MLNLLVERKLLPSYKLAMVKKSIEESGHLFEGQVSDVEALFAFGEYIDMYDTLGDKEVVFNTTLVTLALYEEMKGMNLGPAQIKDVVGKASEEAGIDQYNQQSMTLLLQGLLLPAKEKVGNILNTKGQVDLARKLLGI